MAPTFSKRDGRASSLTLLKESHNSTLDGFSMTVTAQSAVQSNYLVTTDQEHKKAYKFKGISLKESEISRGLVSPTLRVLKKTCTAKDLGPEKVPIRPMPKRGHVFQIENFLTLFSTPQYR